MYYIVYLSFNHFIIYLAKHVEKSSESESESESSESESESELESFKEVVQLITKKRGRPSTKGGNGIEFLFSGFKYHQDSCHIDSVMSLIHFIYNLKFSVEQQNLFQKSFQQLALNFEAFNKTYKEPEMTSLRDRVYGEKFLKGRFYSLSFAFERMLEVFCDDTNLNPIFLFRYNRCVTHDAESTICNDLDNISDTKQKSFFDIAIDISKLNEHLDLSEKLWDTLNLDCPKRCQGCDGITKYYCESILSYPELLIVIVEYYGKIDVDINLQPQIPFDKIIQLGDERYELCAGIYGNGTHFTAILDHEKALYEYDDMVQKGKVRRRSCDHNNFFPVIKFADGCVRNANMLFFKLKTWSFMEIRNENIEKNNKFLGMLNLQDIKTEKQKRGRPATKLENHNEDTNQYCALTNAQRKTHRKYIEKIGSAFEDVDDDGILFEGVIQDVLMYKYDEIEGVCFSYHVTNKAEDEPQFIFVESLINSPHFLWLDNSDNNPKQKPGWRGYAEVPIHSLPVPLSAQFEELTTEKNNGKRKLRSGNI